MDSQKIKAKRFDIESQYLMKLLQLIIDNVNKDKEDIDYEKLKAKQYELESQLLQLKISKEEKICDAEHRCDKIKSKYMIWKMSTLKIEVEHATIESAMAEAERIARFNPGSEVYVLKQMAVAVVPYGDVQWKKIDIDLSDDDEPDDDIPLPF